MRKKLVMAGLSLGLCLGGTMTVQAYESLYERTPVGTVEVKELPAMRLLEASADKGYYEQGNDLFMTLFRYIRKHKVAMTVPVESDTNRGSMRFLVPSDRDASLTNGDGVAVEDRPAQTVVSFGLRGSYREELARQGMSKLEAWLAEHPEYESAGEPYSVFWNSPFMPGFLKRSEVHWPVKKAKPAAIMDQGAGTVKKR